VETTGKYVPFHFQNPGLTDSKAGKMERNEHIVFR